MSVSIFYVENLFDAAGDVSFGVRRFDETRVDPAVTPQLGMRDDAEVKLAVTPDQSIIAHTGSRLMAIDPSGDASLLAEFTDAEPELATSRAGAITWSTASRASDESWFVEGGSGEARAVVNRDAFCGRRSIETDEGEVSPPLCDIRAMVWVDAETLIISAGTEDGSVLAKIRPPLK